MKLSKLCASIVLIALSSSVSLLAMEESAKLSLPKKQPKNMVDFLDLEGVDTKNLKFLTAFPMAMKYSKEEINALPIPTELKEYLLDLKQKIAQISNKQWLNVFWKKGLEGVKELLDRGANPNYIDEKDYHKQSPFFRIVTASPSFSHRLDMAKLLLEHGADINLRDKDDYTPLMAASKTGSLESVQFLLDHGARINDKAKDGSTALSLAKQPYIEAPLSIVLV